jgi:hypothetical protein
LHLLKNVIPNAGAVSASTAISREALNDVAMSRF